MGGHHPYIYQNYADNAQDIFAGYGKKNLAKLRAISAKWDKKGVFRKEGLVRGHHKF